MIPVKIKVQFICLLSVDRLRKIEYKHIKAVQANYENLLTFLEINFDISVLAVNILKAYLSWLLSQAKRMLHGWNFMNIHVLRSPNESCKYLWHFFKKCHLALMYHQPNILKPLGNVTNKFEKPEAIKEAEVSISIVFAFIHLNWTRNLKI